MINLTDFRKSQDLTDSVADIIQRAQKHLLDLQYPKGYWWGELESNPTIEAEIILLREFLGIKDENRRNKLHHRESTRLRQRALQKVS